MTLNEKNKYVCEKLGKCWHEPYPIRDRWVMNDTVRCIKCEMWLKVEWRGDGPYGFEFVDSHDYSTDFGAVQLLREMNKRMDWEDFTYACWHNDWVYLYMIVTTPGKLLDAVVEWFRSKEKKK